MATDYFKSLKDTLSGITKPFVMPTVASPNQTRQPTPTAPIAPVQTVSPAPVVTPTPTKTSTPAPIVPMNDTNFENLVNYLRTQNTSINSNVLGSSSTPTVPTPITNNNASNKLEIIGSSAVEDAKRSITGNGNPFIDLLMKQYDKQGGQGARTLSLQEEEQIAEKAKTLNDINKKINDYSIGYDRQIRDRQKNKEGSFGGAVQQDIDSISRERDQHLADLAVLKAGAVGDLALANSIVESKIKAEFDPINNQIATLEKLYSMYQNDMTDSEKFDAQNKIEEAKTKSADLQKAKIDAYQTAVANGAGADVLARIQASTTPDEAYQAIQGYGKSELQRLQEQKLRAEIDSTSPSAVADQNKQATLTQLSLVNNIIESPYLSQVFGLKNPFTYWTPGSNEQNVKNQVAQLRANLSLEARQKLKGSGAISDFEAKTLERSVSALGTNLSDADAKAELARIRGALATSSGLPAVVEVKNPRTGEAHTMLATREGINQAIIDGALVEYK